MTIFTIDETNNITAFATVEAAAAVRRAGRAVASYSVRFYEAGISLLSVVMEQLVNEHSALRKIRARWLSWSGKEVGTQEHKIANAAAPSAETNS